MGDKIIKLIGSGQKFNENKVNKKKNRIAILFGWITLILFGTLIGYSSVTGLMNKYNWSVQYNREIHSHMNNAYYADTPELMKEELNKAIDGMHNLGLTPDLYNDMRPWLHTPDNQMDYQYKHLQSVIERTDDVIRWKQSDNTGTQATDVYEAKMLALRHFIRDDGGWSDSIAAGAYYVKYHNIYKTIEDFGSILAFPYMVLAFGSLIGWIGFKFSAYNKAFSY